MIRNGCFWKLSEKQAASDCLSMQEREPVARFLQKKPAAYDKRFRTEYMRKQEESMIPIQSKKPMIRIRGAHENNLKGIDLDIPRNELVVLTGLSGSGKSSLAFDTIYAEGQRRYMESLSSMRDSFWGRWKNQMWRVSRVCPRRSPLTRNPPTGIQGLRWER